MRALIQVIANAAALLLAAHLVPGVHWTGSWLGLLLAGIVLGLINLIVRPIVKLLSLPFIIITLGLFYLVINALMLFLAAGLLSDLRVDGWLAAIAGGFLIALVNWVVRAFGDDD
jgi:putative membrane protein